MQPASLKKLLLEKDGPFIDPYLEKRLAFSKDSCNLFDWIDPSDLPLFKEELERACQTKDHLEKRFYLLFLEERCEVQLTAFIALQDGNYHIVKGALLKRASHPLSKDPKLLFQSQKFLDWLDYIFSCKGDLQSAHSLPIESLPCLIWSATADGFVDFYNQSWQIVFGTCQYGGSDWLSVVHPDNQQASWQSWQKAICDGQAYQQEQRIRLSDGSYRWYLNRAWPLKGLSGQVIRWFGLSTDIDSFKWAEEERERLLVLEKKRSQHLQALSEYALNINACFSPHLIAGHTSHCILNTTGCLSRIELFAFPSLNREEQAMAPTHMPTLSIPLASKGKKRIGLIEIWAPLHAPLNENAHSILIQIAQMAFVTLEKTRLYHEQKLAEKQAKESMRLAEKASNSKSAFLANMSHEIRTPLSALLGFTELLIEASLPNEREQFAETIRRNGRHLTALIDDILDLSKIEYGLLSAEKIPFSLNELLLEIESLLLPAARKKGIALTIEQEAHLPDIISSDPTRLRQILINVIGNAIKFTERGSVRLCVKEDHGLLFSVKDSGIGIKEECLERLFQPFMQGDESIARRYGGAGLGLALSKRLAQALGGDLQLIESTDAGSTFQISIALNRPDNSLVLQAAPKRPHYSLKGVKVLVCEDSIDHQQLLLHFLNKAQAEVDIAFDGREGVSKALSHTYDVILLDIQMPHMGGTAVAATLRQMGYCRPIIALTAHAMAEDIEKSLQAGCNDHLTKPIDSLLLIEKVFLFSRPFSFEGETLTFAQEGAPDEIGQELQELFLNTLDQRIQEIKKRLEKEEFARIGQIAHQIRGTAASYGYPRIGQLAAQVEMLIDQKKEADLIISSIQALIEEA
ncbi:MAG: rpfC 2 [Chlamydiales bacterium]|jgi:PAS domain S-box-containing protein|nr:rpfC 2 [Chlamydiales bacterium]